jgi:hypothetical protein
MGSLYTIGANGPLHRNRKVLGLGTDLTEMKIKYLTKTDIPALILAKAAGHSTIIFSHHNKIMFKFLF